MHIPWQGIFPTNPITMRSWSLIGLRLLRASRSSSGDGPGASLGGPRSPRVRRARPQCAEGFHASATPHGFHLWGSAAVVTLLWFWSVGQTAGGLGLFHAAVDACSCPRGGGRGTGPLSRLSSRTSLWKAALVVLALSADAALRSFEHYPTIHSPVRRIFFFLPEMAPAGAVPRHDRPASPAAGEMHRPRSRIAWDYCSG